MDTVLTPNLRKAAILIRSVDTDTAATLLAQLSPAEAKAVRSAIQALGAVEDDERDDVAAEFRRVGPAANIDPSCGVELAFSSAIAQNENRPTGAAVSRPFEFLEHARVESLVPFLAREHGQTIAIVLSYLAPDRAAKILGALPPRSQADALERLAALGETDPGSIEVLERELADWVGRQRANRSREVHRIDSVTAILAAADKATRERILGNVALQNQQLAEQIAPRAADKPRGAPRNDVAELASAPTLPQPAAPPPKPRPTMPFEQLVHADKSMLAAVMRAVDAEVLVLALSGASDALVDRIADQMPRATSKAFRRRLRQFSPTRLRDVDAAQQEVATVAAELIQMRRSAGTTGK